MGSPLGHTQYCVDESEARPESEARVLGNQEMPRILVIEHDAWVRADVVGQLTRAGYDVRDASNGFSGVRLASQAPPDIILLGARLPDLPASGVLEELREHARTRAIPIVPLLIQAGKVSMSLPTEVRKALRQEGRLVSAPTRHPAPLVVLAGVRRNGLATPGHEPAARLISVLPTPSRARIRHGKGRRRR